jgi:hypothetical protein
MTDEELITRLRDLGLNSPNIAADRIEHLVKERRFILDERDRTFALMLTRAESAEAKLAKTVAALRDVVSANHSLNGARVVLDELEKTE